MKKELYFVFALLLISVCSASPSFLFQKDSYQPQETIIGEIRDIDSTITRDDIKIYEGRREIMFEKDVLFFNNTYYVYFIPTKEGSFSLNISDLLYTENEKLESMNFEKEFKIVRVLDENNKSSIITIRPGFYKGTNPELFITNSGDNLLQVNYNDENITLNSGDSRKINATRNIGFSYTVIKSYFEFKVPIIYTPIEIIENNTNTANITQINETKIYSILFLQNITINTIKENETIYFFNITNVGNINLTNINLKTELDYVDFTNIESLNIGETKTINISIEENPVGVHSTKLEIYSDDKLINETYLQIITFKTEQEQTTFQNTSFSNTASCGSMNGKFCSEKEECINPSGENCSYGTCWTYNVGEKNECCLMKCKTIDDGTKSNPTQIILGLLIFAAVIFIAYVLYKKSNEKKGISPSEKFKEVERNNKK